MFSSPPYYQTRPSTRVSILSPFLRHLNAGTLVFVMLVALALLNTTSGTDSETRGSALTDGKKTEAVNGTCHTSDPARPEIQGHEFIAKDFGNKTGLNR